MRFNKIRKIGIYRRIKLKTTQRRVECRNKATVRVSFYAISYLSLRKVSLNVDFTAKQEKSSKYTTTNCKILPFALLELEGSRVENLLLIERNETVIRQLDYNRIIWMIISRTLRVLSLDTDDKNQRDRTFLRTPPPRRVWIRNCSGFLPRCVRIREDV